MWLRAVRSVLIDGDVEAWAEVVMAAQKPDESWDSA
jgi:hypothetical protein